MAHTEEKPMSWRQRRIALLIKRIEAGEYHVPAADVAHAILHGRPRFGENPVVTADVRVSVDSSIF
jgi:hypothetical protein